MKKTLSLILALVLCFGLFACANYDEMKEILCTGEWVSFDNVNDKLGTSYAQTYPAMRFFEDGTCEVDYTWYKDGLQTSLNTSKYNWKIEDGKVAVYPDIVDSDSDTQYYEYKDGILIGSAWYCDRFTYAHVSTSSNQEESSEPLEETQVEPDKGQIYRDALALFEEGKYEESFELFVSLEDYQDAADYVSGFHKRKSKLHHEAYPTSGSVTPSYEYFVNYTYDKQGNLISEETVVPERPDVVVPHMWEYAYDENGIMTQATVTNYTSSTSKEITSSTTYTYDPNGITIGWTYVKYDNGTEARNASDYENTFFDNGCISHQKSTTVTENTTTTTETFYDERGNQIRWLQTSKSESGTVVYDYCYTYDEYGNIITKSDGEKFYEYTYNKEGELLSGTCTDKNGHVEDIVLNYTLTYDYDYNGNLVEREKCFDAGRVDTTKYTYDADGNLITESEWMGGILLHESHYTYELFYLPEA